MLPRAPRLRRWGCSSLRPSASLLSSCDAPQEDALNLVGLSRLRIDRDNGTAELPAPRPLNAETLRETGEKPVQHRACLHPDDPFGRARHPEVANVRRPAR